MEQKRFNRQTVFRFKKFSRKAYGAFNSMHKVVNIGVLAGCTLAMFSSSPLLAQDDSKQPTKTLEKELDEVMVTASRVELPVNQTAKLVTIVTKEQIAQAPVQSIQDLLVYVANLDVIQRGGHGVQADISIRGGSGDQNAILLNGVNLSNAQTGHYSFDIPINLSDIERIEIIHGPSALIYGASAFSGGINIITKKRTEEKAYARIESGMHKLRGIEVRGAGKKGIATNSLSVGYNSSEGYIPNTDYDIYNVLWQTRLNLKTDSRLDFQLGYNDKKYGANNFYSPKYPNQYERTSSYMGSMKGEFGSTFKIIPILYWDRHHDQYDLIKDTDNGRNYHRNDTYGTNLIFLYKSKLGNTSLGNELRREEILSSNLGKPLDVPQGKYTKEDARTNFSTALEHTVILEQFVLSGGVLMNYNTRQKGQYKFFPSFSANYRPTDKINISSSWSKSTRIPTFTELFYKSPIIEGNSHLKPEQSQSLDLAFKYKNSFISSYITGFLMWGRDVIDWVEINKVSTAWNHTKLNTQGIETGVRFNLAEYLPVFGKTGSLAFDYARMNQTVDTEQLKSEYSLNYLRDKFVAQFNHQVYGNFSVGWFFRYQKRMGMYKKYENKEDKGYAPYRAFSTLDLKLSYTYDKLLFYVNLNNLCDTHYFDRGNIPQPGFWFMGGISYTLK